jgi:integrase
MGANAMSPKSITSTANDKPARPKAKATEWKKPYDDFPLSYHPHSGRLYKVIKGHRHYFGYATDWKAAIERYITERDDIQAGRKPRKKRDGAVTLEDACNLFMRFKEDRLASGELRKRTYEDCYRTCKLILSEFGKYRAVEDIRPEDFAALRSKLAKAWSPVTLNNEVGRIRGVFKFAYDNHLIDSPIRYGKSFDRPSKKTLRIEKAKAPKKFFDAWEIKRLLAVASVKLEAMILLACNGGMGNSDCAELELRHVDLKRGWIDYARVKTGIDRRIPLWPETAEALRAVIAERPVASNRDDAEKVFITRWGSNFADDQSSICKEFRKVMEAADEAAQAQAEKDGTKNPASIIQKGRGIYSLRHTFETIGGASRDQVAVNFIMGHCDNSMAGNYREHIDDDRLQAVVDHVHAWLFGAEGKEGGAE